MHCYRLQSLCMFWFFIFWLEFTVPSRANCHGSQSRFSFGALAIQVLSPSLARFLVSSRVWSDSTVDDDRWHVCCLYYFRMSAFCAAQLFFTNECLQTNVLLNALPALLLKILMSVHKRMHFLCFFCTCALLLISKFVKDERKHRAPNNFLSSIGLGLLVLSCLFWSSLSFKSPFLRLALPKLLYLLYNVVDLVSTGCPNWSSHFVQSGLSPLHALHMQSAQQAGGDLRDLLAARNNKAVRPFSNFAAGHQVSWWREWLPWLWSGEF